MGGLKLHTIRALGIKLAAVFGSEAPGENVTFSRRRKEGDLEEEEALLPRNYLGAPVPFGPPQYSETPTLIGLVNIKHLERE